MYMFRVAKKHGSDKKHIAFKYSPEDEGSWDACKSALGRHGFVFDYDGAYLNFRHPDPASPSSYISIESDEQGCIWGEGCQWGGTKSNHAARSTLASLLEESRLFQTCGLRFPVAVEGISRDVHDLARLRDVA